MEAVRPKMPNTTGRCTTMNTDGNMVPDFESLVDAPGADWTAATRAAGPAGRLPLTEQMLREAPSGDLFGLSLDAGMGWDPAALTADRKEFLILSTQGGLRGEDGRPI